MTDRALSVLPHHATDLERALEAQTAPADNAAVLETLALPDQIPAASLPWLAWGEDVPWWPPALEQRRDVTARSFALHGQIGTAAGLKAGARLAGCELERLEAHPATMFWSHWDEDSRAAWLAKQPQLRIYARRQRASASGFQLGDAFWGEWLLATDAAFRATARVTRWQNGVETELVTREWQDGEAGGEAVLRVARKAIAGGFHWGDCLPGQWVTSDAAARFWSFDTRAYRYPTSALLIRTAQPGFTARAVDAETVVSERAARPGVACWSAPPPLSGDGHLRRFAGREHAIMSWGDAFWSRSDPEQRMYRRVYLHDPAVSPVQSGGLAFWNVSRFGLAPWTARARLRLPSRRSSSAHWGDPLPAHTAHRNAFAPLRAVLPALDWFRSPQQKIGVDTRRHEIVTAGRVLTAGEAVAGQVNLRI